MTVKPDGTCNGVGTRYDRTVPLYFRDPEGLSTGTETVLSSSLYWARTKIRRSLTRVRYGKVRWCKEERHQHPVTQLRGELEIDHLLLLLGTDRPTYTTKCPLINYVQCIHRTMDPPFSTESLQCTVKSSRGGLHRYKLIKFT